MCFLCVLTKLVFLPSQNIQYSSISAVLTNSCNIYCALTDPHDQQKERSKKPNKKQRIALRRKRPLLKKPVLFLLLTQVTDKCGVFYRLIMQTITIFLQKKYIVVSSIQAVPPRSHLSSHLIPCGECAQALPVSSGLLENNYVDQETKHLFISLIICL